MIFKTYKRLRNFILIWLLPLRIQTPPGSNRMFWVPIAYILRIGMDRGNPEILGHTNGFLGHNHRSSPSRTCKGSTNSKTWSSGRSCWVQWPRVKQIWRRKLALPVGKKGGRKNAKKPLWLVTKKHGVGNVIDQQKLVWFKFLNGTVNGNNVKESKRCSHLFSFWCGLYI